jgi:hypothetical protein
VPLGRSDWKRMEESERERRLELLRRLPQQAQHILRWLRQPAPRRVRIPMGLLLILGGVFSILPILGLWMLPLGLALLAENIKPLKAAIGRMLSWIEHRRPHWMGLPRTA